jgi:hypothetical protein
MTPTPIPPPSVAVDAKNRAWRTFIQGLLSDVLITALVTLTAALSDPGFVFSRVYLTGVAILIAKSALSAGIAYGMRYSKPPGS